MSDQPRTATFDVIADEMAAVLRQKTPAERLAIGHALWRHARQMLLAVLQDQHPEWTHEQICREAAHRLSHGAV